MTHVCAKPACAEQVEVWLDFAPATRLVIEQRRRTDVSVGLCTTHAARFTVPTGWRLQRLPAAVDEVGATTGRTAEESADETAAVVERSSVERSAKRRHRRDRPWFLAAADVPANAADGPAAEIDQAAVEPAVAGPTSTAGPLLQRAFHGPDREADVARAAREHQDELETRRTARSDASSRDGDGGHGMAELPFPPFEPEHQAAVS